METNFFENKIGWETADHFGSHKPSAFPESTTTSSEYQSRLGPNRNIVLSGWKIVYKYFFGKFFEDAIRQSIFDF